MDKYLSTYQNRIDAKGRVSVPAPFRTILNQEGFEGVFCYPSLDHPAIDAGGTRLIGQIDELISKVGSFTDDHDDLSRALYGDSITLKIDGDGRISLPEDLKGLAGITDHVSFVGMGNHFQILSPETSDRLRQENREKLKDFKRLLGEAARNEARLLRSREPGVRE